MGEINWNVVITIGTIVVSISSAFMLVKNKTEQHEKDLNRVEINVSKEMTVIETKITESNKEITLLKEKSIIVARDIELYRNENHALKESLKKEIDNQIKVLSLQMDNRFDKLETLITNTVANKVVGA